MKMTLSVTKQDKHLQLFAEKKLFEEKKQWNYLQPRLQIFGKKT